MGNNLEELKEIENAINELNENPDVVIENKIHELNFAIEHLNLKNFKNNSVYNNLLLLKNKIELNPKRWIKEEIDRLVEQSISVDVNFVILKKRRRIEVDRIRDSFFFSDIPYLYPGDTDIDTIQLRDSRDRQNIQDCVMAAQIDIAEGNPDKICTFISGNNIVKFLTARQMVGIGMFLKNRGESIYNIAWFHKNEIDKLNRKEDIIGYDITLGWPEG